MIPHLRPVKEMATLMHSPEISELMHEEAPIDLLIRLDEVGLSRLDVAGLSLSDADEVSLGTDPTLRDTDGDFAWDDIEVELGLDPFDPDSDDDGLLDGEEVDEHGSDMTEATSVEAWALLSSADARARSKPACLSRSPARRADEIALS